MTVFRPRRQRRLRVVRSSACWPREQELLFSTHRFDLSRSSARCRDFVGRSSGRRTPLVRGIGSVRLPSRVFAASPTCRLHAVAHEILDAIGGHDHAAGPPLLAPAGISSADCSPVPLDTAPTVQRMIIGVCAVFFSSPIAGACARDGSAQLAPSTRRAYSRLYSPATHFSSPSMWIVASCGARRPCALRTKQFLAC